MESVGILLNAALEAAAPRVEWVEKILVFIQASSKTFKIQCPTVDPVTGLCGMTDPINKTELLDELRKEYVAWM